jgi:hypothetical protein
MTEKTKVLYDVNDAIKELERLNKKVEESGDKANDSFEKGGDGANVFGKAVGRLSGPVKAAGTAIKTAVTSLASLPGVALVAVGAMAAVVAQFIDFDGILKDSIRSIEGFNEATDTIQQTKDAFSSLGDAAVNRDLRLAQRAVKLDQAENARAQNAVERERNRAKQFLDITKDELSRREGLLKASIKKEQSLRDRLADRKTTDAAAGFGGPVGKRALDLGAAARRAAFDGDIDKAEALEEAAKRAAEEAGNHNLYLRDQQSTRNAINNSLERQIAKEDQTGKKLQEQVDEAQTVADALDELIDKDNQRLIVLRQQSRELGAQQKLLRTATREATETQSADQAARDFENNARDFNNAMVNGNQSLKENVLSFGSELKGFFSNNAQRLGFIKDVGAGAAGAGEIERVLAKVARGGRVTPAEIEGIKEPVNRLTDAVAKLQFAREEGRLTSGTEKTLERMENLLGSVQGAIEAAADFRAVRGDDQAIVEGTRGPTGDDMRALRDSILELNRTIGGQPTRAHAAAINDQTQSVGAATPTTQGPSNVTVNANVKGGMIDEVVTKKITDIIRRELRKQTTKGTE